MESTAANRKVYSKVIPFASVYTTDLGAWFTALMEVQEEERRRISQELHDDLGQRLALLEIQIDQVQRGCLSPDASQKLREMKERIGEMDRDLHRICYRLHPVVLEQLGLIVAIGSLCREFSETSGIHTNFIHQDLSVPIAKETSLCVYRLLQEALHNVAKHANAHQANVSLIETSAGIEVTVEDLGCGFDRLRARDQAGLGLVSIQERVRRVGGRFFIRSRHGGGTTVGAVLPIRPEVIVGETRRITPAKC